jgi:hypothetical protein
MDARGDDEIAGRKPFLDADAPDHRLAEPDRPARHGLGGLVHNPNEAAGRIMAVRGSSKMTAVDQPNSSTPFIAVIFMRDIVSPSSVVAEIGSRVPQPHFHASCG